MRGAWVIFLLSAAAPAAADNGPHKEGQYGGVTPGELAPREAGKPARARRPPPKGTLTWIGFEAKDGGAEVFFQSVAPFAVSQRLEGATLIVHLALTRLGGNTWRAIDTRYFDNPLAGVVARAVGAARATKARPARGAGIEARIAFKSAKDAREATLRTATEADGRYYAYLSFPEGVGSAPPADPGAGSAAAGTRALEPTEPAADPAEPASEPVTEPEPGRSAKKPAPPPRPTAQERDDDAPPTKAR